LTTDSRPIWRCGRWAIVPGDDAFTIETGYTSLTRGRLSNQLYLVAPEAELSHWPQPELDPVASFKAALHRSRAKTAVVDHLAPTGVDV